MPNVDPEHFLRNIRVSLFADFSAVTFILQALSPVTLISLQPGLQYSLNITLESFRVFWTGLHFEYYLTFDFNLRRLENLIQSNETKTRNVVHRNCSTHLWRHIFL